jgi:hypothetical protein
MPGNVHFHPLREVHLSQGARLFAVFTRITAQEALLHRMGCMCSAVHRAARAGSAEGRSLPAWFLPCESIPLNSGKEHETDRLLKRLVEHMSLCLLVLQFCRVLVHAFDHASQGPLGLPDRLGHDGGLIVATVDVGDALEDGKRAS